MYERSGSIRLQETESWLQERERQAALSMDVGMALIQSQTLPEMLQRCTEAMVNHLEGAFSRIWTFNELDSTLELKASTGCHPPQSGLYDHIPIGQSKIGILAKERIPYLTNSVADDPAIQDREWAEREGIVAFAGYPLIIEERVVGVMAMFACRPLTELALEALASVAQGIALGIERKRSDEELQIRTRELETLRRVGELLSAESDLDRLIQIVTEEATAISGAQFGSFFYNVEDENNSSEVRRGTSPHPTEFMLFCLSGASREAFANFPMPRKTALFAPTFDGEGVVRSNDITTDSRYGKSAPHFGLPDGHLPVRSYLAIPVISRRGSVIGGLLFGHSQPNVFSARLEKTLLALAAQAALAIDNARLLESAQRELQERREAEATLGLAIDGAQLGTFFCDIPMDKITWNRTCYEHFFLSPDTEVNFDLFYSLIHPDDREMTRHAVSRSMEKREQYNVEYRSVGPNGQVRWINAIGKCYFDPNNAVNRFDGITIDITEKKERERTLGFLVELSDRTREMQSPQEIMRVASQMLGKSLKVARCAYAMVEEDGETFNILYDYADSCPSLVGQYRLSHFGQKVASQLRAGRSLIINDIHRDNRVNASNFKQVQVEATITTALVKGGRLVAMMSVHHTKPRAWTSGEIKLVEMVAERSWAIIERASTDQQLKVHTDEIAALNARLRRSMTETHHRVKNNLQVVAAMIDMQVLDYSKEKSVPIEDFIQLKTHINTLAIVHDLLTTTVKEEEDAQRISARAVLNRLLPLLEQFAANRRIYYDIVDVYLTSRQCIALGLVTNELVTNALKYGRSEAKVQLTCTNEEAELHVEDDGPGFPENFDALARANTGLELVENLVSTDLRGSASYLNRADNGTFGGRVVVRFPLPAKLVLNGTSAR